MSCHAPLPSVLALVLATVFVFILSACQPATETEPVASALLESAPDAERVAAPAEIASVVPDSVPSAAEERPLSEDAQDIAQEVGEEINQEVGQRSAQKIDQEVVEKIDREIGPEITREVGEDVGQEIAEDMAENRAENRAQEITPDIPLEASALSRLAAGNRDFAFAAFRQVLARPDVPDHLLLSPHSILSALAMVYAGADGSTREQMRETLRFALAEPELHLAFAALANALAERAFAAREDGARGFELSVVNRLWGQQDYGFLFEYLDSIQRHYNAGLERVDFENHPDSAREAVNAWVEEETRERIRDLLPPGSVTDDTRLILVNAIYFLASWQDAFEAELTRDQAFLTGSGAAIEVPMMHRTATMAAQVDQDSVVVSLPYLGRDVSLLALMPAMADADFGAWLDALDRERFDALVDGLSPTRVALDFPTLTGGSGFRLAEVLQGMGMPLAFSPTQADFRRMNGVGPGVLGRSLYIDEVFHKTFIKLDEAGTEAAAATAVVMMRLTAMPIEEEPLAIRFDRPFVYAIYDHPTNTILFLGRVLDPRDQMD